MAQSLKKKKHLSNEEEFQIMKLVLDKFLWVGVIIMVYGFYRLVGTSGDLLQSLLILAAGVILLLLFTWILLREYNFMK